VVVRANKGGCIHFEGKPVHDPRLDDGRAQTPYTGHCEGRDDIGRVERQYNEFFPVLVIEIITQYERYVFRLAYLQPGRIGVPLLADQGRPVLRQLIEQVQLVAVAFHVSTHW
jgi:hypothetical protein